MAKKLPKLPKTIYGYWSDESGPNDLFLRTDPEPKSLVEVNETLRVGVYELVGYAIVKNTTNTTSETTAEAAK
jgi:hypothetical protein